MRKIYVAFFTVLLFVLAGNSANAQLTGTKAIPGDYATIAAAVTDLNAQGVGVGGVVFNVAAGHTETSTIPVITATGTSTNTIVFQKSGGGANPKITQATAGTVASTTTLGSHGDGIVIIDGGDYITFDGIDLQTDATFAGVAMMEYGYYLKKASATNACKNVTIKNCAITLNKAAIYSFGIFVSNISGTATVIVTSTGGRSENIRISGNTISNAYGGIQVRGYNHTTAPYDLYDQNIAIGVDAGNTISNYGGGGSTAYAIYGISQNELKINNNIISGGDNSTSIQYGIFVTTSLNSNIDVDANTISITNHATTSMVAGISLQTGATTGTSNTHNIRNNTITNISRPAVTTGTNYFIYTTSNYPLNLNITGNTLGNSSLATTGVIYGIYQLSNPVNAYIQNNTIHSITRTGTTATGEFFGINSDNTTATTQTTISGNVIHSLTGNGSSGIVGGINCASQNIHNVYNNKIYNITSNHASGVVNGIFLESGTEEYNVYNNIIGDLKAPITTSTTDAIRGISITSTTTTSDINVSFNTIYLNAASTGANFSTSGIFHTTSTTATTATLNLRNNIIVNTSTPAGTGVTVAYRRSTTSLTNFSSSSNNNLYYAGIPSATRLIFYDGTNADQTLIDYKTRVSPIDVNAVTEFPNFVSTTGADPTFLHINTTIPTQIEGGGIPVAGITTDFDGDTRNVTTPDIGADEFAGTSADLSAPLITYTLLPASCNTANRTLSATIIDASGVPTAGPLMPRIYYRKNAGAWFSQPGTLSSGTATNGTWDFNIVVADMGGVTFSDIVYYYIIAQDVAGSANLASNPAGVIATNVNTVTTHPTAPEFYVVGGSLAGTYTIGAAGNIKTLSNAADIYNACPITGPVVFSLIDASYSTNELFPIAFNQNAGSSVTNTLTIQPAPGNAAVISGSAIPLIDLNGGDYIIINGVNAGGSSLTIRNTATNSATIRLINDASNNTIQNSILEGAVTTTTQGVIFLSTGTTTGNDNITIANNTIRDRSDAAGVPANLIYSNASSGTILNSNVTVNANTLKNFTSTAINVAGTGATNSNENWTITSNEIFQEAARTSANTGITFSTQGTGLISQNYIHDLNTTSTVTGITLNDPRNTTVSRNRIIQATVAGSTGTWTGISFVGNSVGDPTVTVVNNQISLIPTTATDQIIRGILDNSLDANTFNVYYNSVLIGGSASVSGTDDTYAFIRESSTPSTTILQNNIFFNNRTGGTANHFAGGDQSMGTGTFTSNYNIWVGTGAIAANIMDRSASTTVTPMTFAQWQASIGSPDANSLSSVAGIGNYTVTGMFVSATDLHASISAAPPSNAGIPVVGITTDFDNDTRHATTPDIGADEFTAVPADLIPPVITYTPLADSCQPGNRTIVATITDVAGVPVAGVLQPRIYFRKNAGTWMSAQGTLTSGDGNSGTWHFTIDAVAMGGLANGDDVQYYIIAQDILNNIGSIPAAGLVATDVNTVTTAPTTPNEYEVLSTLNGVYTVGAAGNYPTLTAAVNAYNTSCISGAVVFELIDATYNAAETFPIVINQNFVASAVNTLTIRPAAGNAAVIFGTSASGALIDLNGADYVIINGVNTGGASLVIRNMSTTIPVIRFINDATNNTITQTTIEGNVTATTPGQVTFSTSTGTLGNSNNTISNSIIRDSADAITSMGAGIYSSGTAAAPNASNIISNNQVYNFTATGINLASTGIGNGWQITGNSFYNNRITPPTATQTSILISGGSSHTITGNFIGGQSVNAGGAAWVNSGNVAFNGINLAGVGAAGAVSVQNNTIQNIQLTATGSGAFAGILVSGASTVNIGTVTGNLIGHATTANSIQSSALSTIIGINSTSTGAMVISNNTISNITSTGTTTAVGVRGIAHTGSGTLTVSNNIVQFLAAANPTTSNSTSALQGIYTSSTSVGQVISGNIVRGLTLTHPTANTFVQGINLNSNVTGLGTASGNIVYDLSNTSTGTSHIIGIDLLTGSWNIVNNMVALSNGTNTNNPRLVGIWDWPGATFTGNNYYNTVSISGSASSGATNSYAYLRSDGGTSALRNNILSNTRTGGTGSHFAIADENTIPGTLLSSNYNDLYAANANTVGEWGIGQPRTFAAWQASSAGDANSISVAPVFLTATDLHLLTGVNPVINNAGTPVAGITIDIDNDIRDIATPDIGADEFTPSVSIDVQALALIDPIVKTCYSNAETVKVSIRNNSAAAHDFALFPVTVNAAVTGPNPVTFAPVVINTGSLAPGATREVVISNSYNMTAAGTYTFNASTTVLGDVNTGNDAMTPVTRTVTAITAGTVSASQATYCITGGTPVLTLTGSAGGTIQWQQSTASATGPWTNVGTGALTYTPASAITATTYYQAVVSCGTNSATTNVVTVTLNSPQVLVTIGGASCGPGAVTLQATASAGATLNWYAAAVGGTSLGTGTLFTTPSLTATTTYYVSAGLGGGSASLGPLNPSIGTTSSSTIVIGTQRTFFDVLSASVTITAVDIFPTAAIGSTFTIVIQNSAGVEIATSGNRVTTVTGGALQNVPLSLTIPQGTGYRIGLGVNPGMNRNTTGAVYPYTVPGVISVTGNSFDPDYWYFMYNWQIGSGCTSAREAVTATIDEPTVGGTAAANQSICVGATPGDIQLTGHIGTVVKWQRSSDAAFTSPIDIAVTSATLTGAQIGPLTATTYFRAVVKSGFCPTANSSVVTITVANPTATIAYTNSPYCIAGGTAAVTHTGSTGGTYSATPAGLSINASTGLITLGTSTAGTYTVTYTIAANGACPLFTTTNSVTISPAGTWLGVTSTDWNTATNWCGGIPTPTTDVVIPSTAPNMPAINSGTGTVRNLTISTGGSVIVGNSGKLDLYGNLTVNGTFNATNGHIAFMGATNQSTPGLTVNNVTMNGAGGWTPGGNSTIAGTLTLTNGHITLGSANLSLSNSATGSLASHIIVNGTGRVVLPGFAASSSRVVPIGINATSYNPIWIVSNAGHITDNLTVGVRQGVFVNGVSGALFTSHVVDRTWIISEGTPGGSNVNLTVQWNAAEELTAFNRVKSYLMQHNGTNWVPGLEIPAAGSNPYTQTKLNVTTFTSFAVQTQPIPRSVTGIYPNPTSSQLNVVIDLPAAQQVAIRIFDAAGKLVIDQKQGLGAGLNLHTMDVAKLSAGVYFIRVSITSNPEYILTRFVKQ